MSVWLLRPTGELIVNEPLPIVCPTVKLVTKPVLILASNMSPVAKSTLVIVAAVPTISVTIPDWILAFVIAKSVAKPAVILASTISILLTSAMSLKVTTPVALILSNLAVSRTSIYL